MITGRKIEAVFLCPYSASQDDCSHIQPGIQRNSLIQSESPASCKQRSLGLEWSAVFPCCSRESSGRAKVFKSCSDGRWKFSLLSLRIWLCGTCAVSISSWSEYPSHCFNVLRFTL